MKLFSKNIKSSEVFDLSSHPCIAKIDLMKGDCTKDMSYYKRKKEEKDTLKYDIKQSTNISKL